MRVYVFQLCPLCAPFQAPPTTSDDSKNWHFLMVKKREKISKAPLFFLVRSESTARTNTSVGHGQMAGASLFFSRPAAIK